jgi:hypothetical protein
MSVSSPFIHRPIATSLLGIAVMLGGMLGYLSLPVSSLPQVDFPTIQVTTQLPGASPDVMASLVTAPLERNFGQIPSLQLMTSSSSLGISQITLQLDLNREIDAVGWREHLRSWWFVSERWMRSDRFIVVRSALDDHLSVPQSIEDLPVQRFVAQAHIEAQVRSR